MVVEVLVIPDCPHRSASVTLVRDVVRELGIEAEVREIRVVSDAEAKALRFPGSPTIRVNGVDVDPDPPADDAIARCCRLYGRSGVPSREALRAALARGAIR